MFFTHLSFILCTLRTLEWCSHCLNESAHEKRIPLKSWPSCFHHHNSRGCHIILSNSWKRGYPHDHDNKGSTRVCILIKFRSWGSDLTILNFRLCCNGAFWGKGVPFFFNAFCFTNKLSSYEGYTETGACREDFFNIATHETHVLLHYSCKHYLFK